jgi:hypothetical protein
MTSEWKTASVIRLYRGTTYKVTIRNPRGEANAPVETVTVDGNPHPVRAPLPIDRKTHTVAVRLA